MSKEALSVIDPVVLIYIFLCVAKAFRDRWQSFCRV
jgi:hypothetical protein